jgi:hypothetical protein
VTTGPRELKIAPCDLIPGLFDPGVSFFAARSPLFGPGCGDDAAMLLMKLLVQFSLAVMGSSLLLAALMVMIYRLV